MVCLLEHGLNEIGALAEVRGGARGGAWCVCWSATSMR